MDKPLALKIQEFQQNISDVISKSELPIYILKYQIRDLATEIDKLAENMAQEELQKYYQSQEEESKEEESE